MLTLSPLLTIWRLFFFLENEVRTNSCPCWYLVFEEASDFLKKKKKGWRTGGCEGQITVHRPWWRSGGDSCKNSVLWLCGLDWTEKRIVAALTRQTREKHSADSQICDTLCIFKVHKLQEVRKCRFNCSYVEVRDTFVNPVTCVCILVTFVQSRTFLCVHLKNISGSHLHVNP